MPNDKGNVGNRNIVESVFKEWGIALFGIADLKGIATPRDKNGTEYPRAVSFVVPMNPEIMSSIRKGPNKAYADEYNRVNRTINEIARSIEVRIHERGARAQMISASDRTDLFTIKGDFPHKTAATRAGLGWVGRNCLLITKQHGPWIRLGTVLTDLAVGADVPVIKNYCGKCRECVDSCPAGALAGNSWYPGIPRHEILDVFACDRWKKEHYFRYNKGHNCGICAAVCPFGK